MRETTEARTVRGLRRAERGTRCAALLLALLLLVPLAGAGAAPEGPRPPCGNGPPSPAYAEAGASPVVRVWTGAELDRGWTPPPCTGWQPLPFRTLVAVAGRFRHREDVDGLLRRFGAISGLTTVRYWSVTERGWRTLITDASALSGPDPSARRPDFGAAEVAAGADLHFAQRDNRTTGDILYRLRAREVGPNRLVVETENVGPVRYLVVPLAGPGDLQAVHLLERLSPDEWGYYGLARTGAGTSPLAAGHKASVINRAVALFRHFAGLPTDQGPPAAP